MIITCPVCSYIQHDQHRFYCSACRGHGKVKLSPITDPDPDPEGSADESGHSTGDIF